MKRLLSVLLICVMLVGSALADSGAKVDLERLGIYSALAHDETTGEWSVLSNQASMALQVVERNAVNYTDSFLILWLELGGSLATGRLSPILHLLYVDTEEIHPASVSILVGRERYDFLVSAQDETVGREHAEHIRILMDKDSLSMLRAISRDGVAQVRLGGGAGRVNVTLQVMESYKTPLQKAHGLSVEGIFPMLEELDAMGYEGYDLVDLSRTHWAAQGMEKTKYQAVPLLDELPQLPVDIDNDLQMIASGASGRDTTRIQQRLMELGYLNMTSATGTYAESTAAAVRAAQRYYGQLETGSADAALLVKLFSDDQSPVRPEKETSEPMTSMSAQGTVSARLDEAYELSGSGILRLDRSWCAPAVSTVSDTGVSAVRTVDNRDHTFLIADGRFISLAPRSANLYTSLQVKALFDGYEYECYAVCQADGGSRFDTSVLPLDDVRVVFYAEIPSSLAGKPFELAVSGGGAELIYDLK